MTHKLFICIEKLTWKFPFRKSTIWKNLLVNEKDFFLLMMTRACCNHLQTWKKGSIRLRKRFEHRKMMPKTFFLTSNQHFICCRRRKIVQALQDSNKFQSYMFYIFPYKTSFSFIYLFVVRIAYGLGCLSYWLLSDSMELVSWEPVRSILFPVNIWVDDSYTYCSNGYRSDMISITWKTSGQR